MNDRGPSLPCTATDTPAAPWTRRRLWTFRTGVVLLFLQLVVSFLDASPGTRAVADAMQGAARTALAAVLPGIVAAIEHLAARSDGHAVALGLLRDGFLAVVGAALWTACDRRRRHERFAGAVRVTLRYLVAVVMLIYGGLKVVPVQFQVPAAEVLLQPLGERTPMGLLWAFVGASPAYTVFAGLGESLGGLLLLWRRTTTLGALILIGVLTNVVMLNFCYDVPVKRGAALLLLAAIVLASRDAGRLGRVLLDRPTDAGREAPFGGGRWLRRARALLKPVIAALAIAGPMIVALVMGRHSHAMPLQGVYTVERFVRDGVEVPPSRDETARWRRLVLGDYGGAVVQTMNDRCERFGLAIDERARTLALTAAGGAPVLRFDYDTAAGQALRLHRQGASIQDVTLRPVPATTVFRVLH